MSTSPQETSSLEAILWKPFVFKWFWRTKDLMFIHSQWKREWKTSGSSPHQHGHQPRNIWQDAFVANKGGISENFPEDSHFRDVSDHNHNVSDPILSGNVVSRWLLSALRQAPLSDRPAQSLTSCYFLIPDDKQRRMSWRHWYTPSYALCCMSCIDLVSCFDSGIKEEKQKWNLGPLSYRMA